MDAPITGFSKLTKTQKINWLIATYFNNDDSVRTLLTSYYAHDHHLQELHDGFSENTITNYYLPFGLAPNFLIDNRLVTIPMAIEESSVVAAASKAAKFWLDRGGFTTRIISTIKSGQVHLMYHGDSSVMDAFFAFAKADLLQSITDINASMHKRGGGILDLKLVNKTTDLDGYYQLHATFDTKDAMGANFINTTLEQLAQTIKHKTNQFDQFTDSKPEVVMSILSNYVPQCLVNVSVSCSIDQIGEVNGLDAQDFVRKFIQAVDIAQVDPYRAVTHNKGIMNGIDAVVIATGNDFRAIEAGVHAYAARSGQYRSLTRANINDGVFTFQADFPLALGTVGGLTSIHPLSKIAMNILGNPSAQDLMRVTAVCGLAQNFAALHSLVTTGIQAGHMKMHLTNMLEQIGANEYEKKQLKNAFKDKTPSFAGLRDQLVAIRNN